MKKSRRNKRKLTVNWSEESYRPLMVIRAMPKTGDTRIIYASTPASCPQEERTAA